MGRVCLLLLAGTLLLLLPRAHGSACYGGACPVGEDCPLGNRDGSDAVCDPGQYVPTCPFATRLAVCGCCSTRAAGRGSFCFPPACDLRRH